MFLGYLAYGLFYAYSLYWVAYYVQTQITQTFEDGKAIGLWVSGDNTYGLCVLVANLTLFYRQNTIDRKGAFLYLVGPASYFIILWLESKTTVFPKLYGTVDKAWG